MLEQAGWKVQPRKKIDFNAGPCIAVREYETDVGPADYVLFVNKPAVGVIEAKPEYWGQKITTVEERSQSYATAELKWVNNNPPLPFVADCSLISDEASGKVGVTLATAVIPATLSATATASADRRSRCPLSLPWPGGG